jgi:hypothetical protein
MARVPEIANMLRDKDYDVRREVAMTFTELARGGLYIIPIQQQKFDQYFRFSSRYHCTYYPPTCRNV